LWLWLFGAWCLWHKKRHETPACNTLTLLPSLLHAPSGRLDAEVLSVTRRVGELLQKLPRDINPVNLEELRRIKQALVELENKVGGRGMCLV
jgi:hypothetical protein